MELGFLYVSFRSFVFWVDLLVVLFRVVVCRWLVGIEDLERDTEFTERE